MKKDYVKNNQSSIKLEAKRGYEEDEEAPEWGDDDVCDFKKSKIEFQKIPKEIQIAFTNSHNCQNGDKSNNDPEDANKENEDQDHNVITGDQLFQIDSDLLFNKTIENKDKSTFSNNMKEKQFKSDDDFFKDMSNKQKPISKTNKASNDNKSLKNNNNGMFINQASNYTNMLNMQYVNNQMKQRMIQMQGNPYINYNQPIQMMPNRALHLNSYPTQMEMNFPQINNNCFRPPIYNHNNINYFHIFNNINQNQSSLLSSIQVNQQTNHNNNSINEQNINNDDKDDDLMNNFNVNYNNYNPSVFLENPALLVKKNLFESNWFLMKDNKIKGNYNSEELLYYLMENLAKTELMSDVSISDYHTDLFFKPDNLIDILKEYVPKLKKKYEMMNCNPFNHFINNNTPMSNNTFCFYDQIHNDCIKNKYKW